MIIKDKGNYRIYISQKNDGDVKTRTRDSFLSEFFIPEQNHTNKIINLEELRHSFSDTEEDGIISENIGTKTGVSLADCNGIVFMGERYFAVIHAGWRGLYNGIIENLLEKMIQYGEDFSRMQVFVGPSIRQCCYKVGEEFLEFFSEKYFIRKDKKLFFDMIKVILDKLQGFGLSAENIETENICTKCSCDDLFSYRGGDNGGFLVGLEKKE